MTNLGYFFLGGVVFAMLEIVILILIGLYGKSRKNICPLCRKFSIIHFENGTEQYLCDIGKFPVQKNCLWFYPAQKYQSLVLKERMNDENSRL